MAQYQIISDDAPYYTVKVVFADHQFTQQLTSVKKGAALAAQFQAYADEYEAAWVPPPAPAPAAEEALTVEPEPEDPEGSPDI